MIHRCQSIIGKYERQRLGIAGSVEDSAQVKSLDSRQDGKRKERHQTKNDDSPKKPFKMVSSLVSDLGAEQPLHVSLSRPNNLKTEERAGFVSLLEERIAKAKVKS